MQKSLARVAALAVMLALTAGCAAQQAFKRGQEAARAGDWDAAVTYYTRAYQANPDKAEYKIALERAMVNASRIHFDRARELEEKGQFAAALGEYRKAAEFDAGNTQAAAKAREIEQMLRDKSEAERPRPAIEQLRERARQARPEPDLDPTSRELLNVQLNNASLKEILTFVGNATGINVIFDREFADRPFTVGLSGVTLEQALRQIMTANQLFYKVLDPRTIIIVPDTPAKRAAYEEQVIRTFFVSHADATEMSTNVQTLLRLTQTPVQPIIVVNKANNSITIRASAGLVAIAERIIDSNDKPRAELVIDVEIMEVSRQRAKRYGLELTQYAIGGVFSPEVPPLGAPGQGVGNQPGTGNTLPPQAVQSPPLVNLNSVSQGVNTADFYGAVPAAILRFLETDTSTKLIAKPSLRGSEGDTLTVNLGDDIPVPQTTFQPVAAGGAASQPLTSFTYRPVGVVVEIKPRVTFEGDVLLELKVESSSLGPDINIAGQNLPSFGSRRVTTRLRMRDGESTLLAGLLREDERKALRGFPGSSCRTTTSR
jgi:type II secretory pathway component GspD/PulD (secretin)